MTLLDMEHYNLLGNGPEPPILAGEPRVMTGGRDDDHLFQDALSLQAPAVDRMYVGNIRYMNGTDQV